MLFKGYILVQIICLFVVSLYLKPVRNVKAYVQRNGNFNITKVYVHLSKTYVNSMSLNKVLVNSVPQ